MYKLITDVVPGDIILEGQNRTTVETVEINPLGCKNHVHINNSACYDAAEVRVKVEHKKVRTAA